MVLCYEVHLDSTENINKRSPCAPSSYYVCQNDILYSERVNGLLSIIFIYFTDICSLYSLWGRKTFHLATVKLYTSCSQTADRKACARNYRPCFRENQPKRSFSIKWKRVFWACFRENWVYKFGHWSLKSEMKFLSPGGKKSIFNWFEWTLPHHPWLTV